MNDETKNMFTRRKFISTTGQTLLAAGLAEGMLKDAQAQNSQAQQTPPAPVRFTPLEAEGEQQKGNPPAPLPPPERIGFAVVGLGRLALEEILPAFGECKKARLAALVSGDANKANTVARQYGVPERSVYNYQTYERLRDNEDVQVIYIVLPNSMHAEFTVRGAAAGKHILSEKPMATSVKECEEMIAACRKAERMLMVAYRIQYEPYNRMAQKMLREKTFGQAKVIDAVNTQRQGDPNQWRLKRALAGGGSLPDIGLYCLNTARFLTGEEPVEVFATIQTPANDPRFREVEDVVSWQMRFPSGIISNNLSSYDAHNSKRYRVHATEGWYGLDPAFSYNGLQMETAHADGKIERIERPRINAKNQFALEMDHMAEYVKSNRQPYTPGEEGLQDHRLMAAIYESAREGKPVKLAAGSRLDAFRGAPPAEDT